MGDSEKYSSEFKQCPKCGQILEHWAKICYNCFYEWPQAKHEFNLANDTRDSTWLILSWGTMIVSIPFFISAFLQAMVTMGPFNFKLYYLILLGLLPLSILSALTFDFINIFNTLTPKHFLGMLIPAMVGLLELVFIIFLILGIY